MLNTIMVEIKYIYTNSTIMRSIDKNIYVSKLNHIEIEQSTDMVRSYFYINPTRRHSIFSFKYSRIGRLGQVLYSVEPIIPNNHSSQYTYVCSIVLLSYWLLTQLPCHTMHMIYVHNCQLPNHLDDFHHLYII